MKKYFLSLLFIFAVSFAFAQDKIYKVGGDIIAAKVTEVGTSEIKYKKWDNMDGPVYVIAKTEVIKIVYENGSVEMMTQDQMSVTPNSTLRMRKRAITTRPFSPLLGFVSIGYQQALTPTRAVVSDVGFIGPKVGTMMDQNAAGFYLKAGMRFKRVPEVVTKDMQWSYALGGFYLEPEVMYSNFTKDISYYNNLTYTTTTTKATFNSGAFLLNIGRQMVFGDMLTLDLSGGLGYGVESHTSIPNSTFDYANLPRFYYSHSSGGQNFPIAYKLSFTIGVLLP
ncbi:MAG: hypothetical protein HY064_06755 [Bacteroidetes bacterium]|nr:hypothetical protein [Bacteroidota bacterium]